MKHVSLGGAFVGMMYVSASPSAHKAAHLAFTFSMLAAVLGFRLSSSAVCQQCLNFTQSGASHLALQKRCRLNTCIVLYLIYIYIHTICATQVGSLCITIILFHL
jgi:hypothetical protein